MSILERRGPIGNHDRGGIGQLEGSIVSSWSSIFRTRQEVHSGSQGSEQSMMEEASYERVRSQDSRLGLQIGCAHTWGAPWEQVLKEKNRPHRWHSISREGQPRWKSLIIDFVLKQKAVEREESEAVDWPMCRIWKESWYKREAMRIVLGPHTLLDWDPEGEAKAVHLSSKLPEQELSGERPSLKPLWITEAKHARKKRFPSCCLYLISWEGFGRREAEPDEESHWEI